MEKTHPWPLPPSNPPGLRGKERPEPVAHPHPDPDLDSVWRVAVQLDLEDRSILETEVLIWRICSAKSLPPDAIRRALRGEWEAGS